jgi:CheY-like chemotaxis protein
LPFRNARFAQATGELRADVLNVTPKAVDFCKYRMMDEFGLETNSELFFLAIREHEVMLMLWFNAIPGPVGILHPSEVLQEHSQPREKLSEPTVDSIADVGTAPTRVLTSRLCPMASSRELRPTVILADDHGGFLDSVSKLLALDFEIVATAMDGRQAVAKAMLHHPDIVVLDVSMPKMSGLDAVLEMRKAGVRSKLVLLTVHQSTDYVSRAFENGADAFVFKSRMSAELVPAIRKALAGGTFVSCRATINGGNRENSFLKNR